MARKRYSDEDALKILREIDVHLHDGGEVTQKILDTYWDFHKRTDLNTEIIYK